MRNEWLVRQDALMVTRTTAVSTIGLLALACAIMGVASGVVWFAGAGLVLCVGVFAGVLLIDRTGD